MRRSRKAGANEHPPPLLRSLKNQPSPMYTHQPFTVPTAEQIAAHIAGHFAGRKQQPEAGQIEEAAKDLHGLFSALHRQEYGDEAQAHYSDRSLVFFKCDKEPPRLDAGAHWWSLFYIGPKGVTRFWPGGSQEIADYLGFDTNNRDRNRMKWGFKSSAIGMDRLLDATGMLTRRLGEILISTGCATEPAKRREPFQFTTRDEL